MADRIQSFEAFWPYYLSEHRSPSSRRLHFAGTTGWLAICGLCLALSPLLFGAAAAAFLALGAAAMRREPRGRPLLLVPGMLLLPALASGGLFLAGVVFAYACAWAGHFRVEHNRPATFQYPIWSLAGDLRMWSHMARGRLWSGDPLAALALEDRWQTAG